MTRVGAGTAGDADDGARDLVEVDWEQGHSRVERIQEQAPRASLCWAC